MSHLFNVYSHAQGACWGFTAEPVAGKVLTAFIDPRNNQVSMESLDPVRLAPAITKMVRSGYKKETNPKYLMTPPGATGQGQFVTQHPDLGAALDGERLFFVAKPSGINMDILVEDWQYRLAQCKSAAGRHDWLAHCRAATHYVPAMSTDAPATLLVAHWAKENNLAMVLEKEGDFPTKGPDEQRHSWRQYLSGSFSDDDLVEAFEDLHWPLHQALVVPTSTTTSAPVAANAHWLSLAQQASF